MTYDPAANARAIIEAGLSAAHGQSSEALLAADRAIERAIAQLASSAPRNADVIIDDALTEIAKLHVRQQISQSL